MAYRIKIEKFEGPLDLLLELIEKEKMDITEVSLSKVADQYLQYLERAEEIDPANLADFLSVAAKLILLKSKALLPEIEIEEEDEESIEDLKLRLREYKRFKEAAQVLAALYKNKDRLFERTYIGNVAHAFYPGEQLDQNAILLAAQGLSRVLDKFERLRKETVRATVSIKEKILDIQSMLSAQTKFKFNSIIKKSKSKVDAIVSFLALLELIKQKLVMVRQSANFSDIEIESSREIN